MGKFIDVSEFNSIDWAKAKSAVDYVYIRCGLRGSLKKTAPKDYGKIRYDKKWAKNLKGVQENGIPFGVYYFPTAINDAEALAGAKWFYDEIKDLNMALPPMLDSENVWGTDHEAGRANSLSKSERTRLLKIVTDYFNQRGMNIGIYASASWFTSHLDMSQFPQSVIDCTWVADSTGAVDYKGYYWLHQYGQETVTGCGKVDVNRITGKIPPVKIGQKPADDPVNVAISIAESYVGYHEGANNKTIFGDEMNRIQPSNMDKNAPWCFTAGTMILTSKGYKPIENIEAGDLVLNAYGNSFNVVHKTMSRESLVNEIRAYGTLKMRSTSDHPFLCNQRLGVRKDWKHTDVEFRPLNKISHGDNVVIPATNEFEDIKLTYDEAWSVGYFVGDGWKTSRGEYRICGNDAKEREVFKHFVGIEKEKDYASRTCHEYRIRIDKNSNIVPLLDLAGIGAENKVVPAPILFANTEIKSAFLDGYMTADGTKEGRFSTVSKALALGVARLVFDIGYGCSVRECIRNENQIIYDSRINDYRPIKIKPIIYYGSINANPSKQRRMDRRDGNLIFVPVKYNNETGEEETVYNITVGGDHTYLANNLAVHNCDAFVDWVIYKTCQRFGYGAETAKKVLCGNFDDYTYNSVNLYKKARRWSNKPARGYQIFFGGSGHTGLVEKVSGGRVYTIEGNKSDQVKRCDYPIGYSSIIGYGMPRYDLISGTVVEEPASTVLRIGSKGKKVEFLQLCLGGLEVDGSFGVDTFAKVTEFQKVHRLQEDGQVGPLTWTAIRKTMPLLKRGDKGRYVKALQLILGGLEVDGSFGSLTRQAVCIFQKEHKLESDGEVGQLTWTKIFDLL